MCARPDGRADIEPLFSFFPFVFVLAAKEGVFDVLGQILEFDVSRLFLHFDRFLSYKAE